jgi:hypothetical protein
MSFGTDFAYALISDVLTPTWTLASPGTELGPQYAVTQLGTIYPHDVFSANETSVRPIADLGAKTEVQGVAIFNTNLTPGLTLKLQANDTNVWPGSSFEQTLVVPAAHKEGFSAGIWFDVVTRTSARSWRYWSLVLGSANSVPISIGMVVLMGTVRRTRGLFIGTPARTLAHAEIRNTSKFGVASVYEVGSRDRILSGSFMSADQAVTLAALRESARGGNRPFFIAPTGAEYTPAAPMSEPLWVEWLDDMQMQGVEADVASVPATFHELSYGQPL